MQNMIRYLFILIVTAFLIYPGCYPLPDRPPKTKDGREYGDTEGLFRHRWWNYYERGLSFADGEFWQDAEPDLREAIRQRNTDKRRARTYGLHFIDYFPHRELGIVLFEQGRIEEAEKELELSYYTVKSAKAALYLDRVRKAIIEKKQIAHHAPEIIVPPPKYDPEKPFITTIRGVANSDAFVSHITVNHQEFRVDISDRIVPFHAEVPLVPGENRIRITAANLMGDSSETFITVDVDNTGPTISIDDDLYDGQIPENSIYVTDDSGLSELTVNGQKFPLLNGKREFRFPDKPLSFPAVKELVIEAKDIAGNITTAKIPFSKMLSKLLADNRALPIGILRVSAGNESPFIHLTHPSEEERLTYRDYAFIEGEVSRIKELFISNDKKKLVFDHGVKTYFSRKVPLPNKDKNEITISGTTILGESVSQPLYITRKSLSDIRPPLKFAISNFNRKPENMNTYLSHDFENSLLSVIRQHGRFEIGISDNDCVLIGEIMETQRQKGVEISVDVKDIESKESLTNIADAYSENVGKAISEELANNIHRKLNDELPLKEGVVVENDSKQIIIDMGSDAKIKKGMKVMIYDIKPVVHPETGKRLDWRFIELGQAKITDISQKISYAALDKGTDAKAIQPKHPVVTR